MPHSIMQMVREKSEMPHTYLTFAILVDSQLGMLESVILVPWKQGIKHTMAKLKGATLRSANSMFLSSWGSSANLPHMLYNPPMWTHYYKIS